MIMQLPLTNIKKFKIINTELYNSLTFNGMKYEGFMCFDSQHDITNQQVEHRYSKYNQNEGIVLNWKENYFKIGWEDNYILFHE